MKFSSLRRAIALRSRKFLSRSVAAPVRMSDAVRPLIESMEQRLLLAATGGFVIPAIEDVDPGAHTVATFTDAAAPNLSPVSADIDWGDSSVSGATLYYNTDMGQYLGV